MVKRKKTTKFRLKEGFFLVLVKRKRPNRKRKGRKKSKVSHVFYRKPLTARLKKIESLLILIVQKTKKKKNRPEQRRILRIIRYKKKTLPLKERVHDYIFRLGFHLYVMRCYGRFLFQMSRAQFILKVYRVAYRYYRRNIYPIYQMIMYLTSASFSVAALSLSLFYWLLFYYFFGG